MGTNSVRVEVDVEDVAASMERLADGLEDAGRDSVRQLSVLAESYIKQEAPEGATGDLRDSVDTRFRRNGLRANIGPRKRTEDGILLASILADDPTWSPDNPPPLGPLREWTAAKWGDGSLAAAARLRASLVEDGMESAPNPFVDRAFELWRPQVEEIVEDNVGDAVDRLGGP